MRKRSANKRAGARGRGAAVGLLAMALLSACQGGGTSAPSGLSGPNTGAGTSADATAAAEAIGTVEASGAAETIGEAGAAGEAGTSRMSSVEDRTVQSGSSAKSSVADGVLSSGIDPKDVKWSFMTWPLMSEKTSTLYAGRDDDGISQLVAWINAARSVDGTGLSAPLKNRSMAVNVELRDGRLIVVRPAWRCETTKLDAGRTQTSCEPVADRIAIEDSAPGAGAATIIAESAELYQFVNEGYKEVMPPVDKYEWPAHLKAGADFTIRGHGARSRKATVTLSRKGAVLWKGTADVQDGEWSVVGTVPGDITADRDYGLEIRTEEEGVTVYLDVE